MNQGISFNNLAEKYGYGQEKNQQSESNWTIEYNLDKEVNKILSEMKIGEISEGVKVDDGYKIFKLNKKRIFGYQMLKYSFIKISSFDIEKLDFSKFSSISCSDEEYKINSDISAIKIKDIVASEMVNVYLEKLEKLEIGRFSKVIDHNNQYSVLKLCDKKMRLMKYRKEKKLKIFYMQKNITNLQVLSLQI